jgi:hypothetical protein
VVDAVFLDSRRNIPRLRDEVREWIAIKNNHTPAPTLATHRGIAEEALKLAPVRTFLSAKPYQPA